MSIQTIQIGILNSMRGPYLLNKVGINSSDLPPLYSNPNLTMRMILNNGVMDSYDPENEFGDDKPYETATMYIDNIRVYQKP